MEHIKRISDLNAPELDVYSRMSENQLRRIFEPEPGLFIAESPKVIMRALDAGYEPVSLLVSEEGIQTGPAGAPLYEGTASEPSEHERARRVLARCPDVPVFAAPLSVLEKLTGFHLTLGMLCAMRRKKLPSPGEICKGARRIALLEDVVNPTNVGAIIRSAAALHIDAVLLTPGCSDPLYRRAARVSVGTVFQVPWTITGGKTAVRQGDTADGAGPGGCRKDSRKNSRGAAPESIRLLKEMGFAAAALALRKDSIPVDDPILRAEEKLALVLGTEGTGLSDETIKVCDYSVIIPMKEGVDSLNVAAAAAVAFWQIGR